MPPSVLNSPVNSNLTFVVKIVEDSLLSPLVKADSPSFFDLIFNNEMGNKRSISEKPSLKPDFTTTYAENPPFKLTNKSKNESGKGFTTLVLE
ncbi:MAG: hypothetical protein ABIK18_01640, partial [candidate division WOR-3 bacterium]